MCQLRDCNRVCMMGVEDSLTPSGHLVGMLDRDQRTAKIVTYQKSADCANGQDVPISPVFVGKHLVPNTNWTRISYKTLKTRTWKTMQRLKQVLVVGTYLLSIVSIPSSLSAPTNRHMADRLSSQPKWINPCGINKDIKDADPEVPALPSKDLLTQIISQANIALAKAKRFREDFAEKSLQEDFNSYHEKWKNQDYEWLPTKTHIRKKLGERIGDGSDDFLSLEESLITIYEHFQKIAVGIEQIVWDQEDFDGSFVREFRETESYLRSLLCEIQMAIIELELTQKPDITRAHMEEEIRKVDTTTRNLRDFLIYRDYMNTLEYAIQMFTHVKTGLR